MPRKAQEINPKSVSRLTGLLEAEGLTQKKFAELVGLSENLISRLVQGRSPLTAASAEAIHAAFPRYSTAYLLGVDDYPSQEQKNLWTAAFSRTMRERQVRATERFIRDLGFLIEPNETYFSYLENEKAVAEATDFKIMVRDIPFTHDISFLGENKGACSEEEVRTLIQSILSFTEFTIFNLCREGDTTNGKPD